jgi:hypothetical protein
MSSLDDAIIEKKERSLSGEGRWMRALRYFGLSPQVS